MHSKCTRYSLFCGLERLLLRGKCQNLVPSGCIICDEYFEILTTDVPGNSSAKVFRIFQKKASLKLNAFEGFFWEILK